MQFQRLQQQLEKISEHVELLHQQEAELDISQNAIDELSKTPLHNEILVPIANGIFFKAEVKENTTLIVHVGSDTTVEHTVEDVLGLLEKQQKEIKSRTVEAEAIVGQMQDQMSLIYKEIAEAEGSERDK